MANQAQLPFRRDEEEEQRVNELNDTVVRLDENVEFIRKGYNLMTEANKESDLKIVVLNGNLKAIDERLMNRIKAIDTTIKAILRTLEKRPFEATNENIALTINGSSQVHPSSSEQIREDRELGYRSYALRNDNRDKLLKKVEMPIFSGKNPYGWVARAERYFRVTRYDPEARMDLVLLSLEEDALSWYNYEVEHRPFVDWSEFKRRLLARFAESYDKTPGKRLFRIQQTGSAAEYVKEFKDLASGLSGRSALD